jgi:hypothetical protein
MYRPEQFGLPEDAKVLVSNDGGIRVGVKQHPDHLLQAPGKIAAESLGFGVRGCRVNAFVDALESVHADDTNHLLR